MSDPNAPAGPPEPVEPVPPQPPAGDYAPPPPAPPAPPAAPTPPPPPGDYSPPPPPPPPGYGTPAAAGVPAVAGDAPFNVGDAFSWGWKKFTENVGPIILAMLVYVAIILVVQIIWYVVIRGIFISSPEVTVNQTTGQISVSSGSGFFAQLLVTALATFVFVALGAFLQAAFIRGALILANGQKKLEVGDMFKFDNFATIFVAALIVAGLTFLGIFACFVGAIVVWFFTSFYMFFLIDKDTGSWESVKASFDFVKNNIGQVFLLVLLAGVVYAVGAALCLVGLIVAAPVALLALTYGYRRLQGEPVAP